jgi:hypothetical protein
MYYIKIDVPRPFGLGDPAGFWPGVKRVVAMVCLVHTYGSDPFESQRILDRRQLRAIHELLLIVVIASNPADSKLEAQPSPRRKTHLLHSGEHVASRVHFRPSITRTSRPITIQHSRIAKEKG